MAYLPPHKRQSNDSSKPSPVPESLPPLFNRTLNLRTISKSKEIKYTPSAVNLWFPVISGDDTDLFSSIHLEDFSVELSEQDTLNKPQILVKSRQEEKEIDETRGEPWVFIAENVHKSLLSAIEILKNESIDSQRIQKVKPTLVARIGKIHFLSSSWTLDTRVREGPLSKPILERFTRKFCTHVSAPYVDTVLARIKALGFIFEDVKEMYLLKLSDKTQKDTKISCKCYIKEDKTLRFHKAELSPARQLVVNISCLDKHSDLRLMSCKKTVLTNLTDEEMRGIIKVVDSAVINPEEKGGLRWPSGRNTSADRYTVCAVWHATSTYYSCTSLNLKIRDAHRYDLLNDTGETSKEVTFNFKGLLSKLKNEKVDETSVSEMLKDNLKLIWNNFL